jgi:phosphoribosyl-ATP pyrophosphohydrolase
LLTVTAKSDDVSTGCNNKARLLVAMADSLTRLYDAVVAAREGDPAQSRTAKLLRQGKAKMAKKLAEEAVEVLLDAMSGNREAVIRESADLIYNLTVLWVEAGVKPEDVWAEMDRRERMMGIAEKLPKLTATGRPRRTVSARPRRPMAQTAR